MVIGTTAHAAFDSTETMFFKRNLSNDDIFKYVSESKIGSLNLTEEALKLYGKTKKGNFHNFKSTKNYFKYFLGLISMISDIRVVCPLLVQARSRPDLAFYVVTQTQEEDIADIKSDIQAILGRYKSDTPERRRYQETMKQLFYYFVSHDKLNHYNSANFILIINQDVHSTNSYSNCDFWIKNNVVPHYSAYF